MAVLIPPTQDQPRDAGLSGRLCVWLAALALLFAAGLPTSAQTPPSREYQVKAVFLFNFAQFVEWPPNAFPETNSPIVIGILGDDPFGSFLDETIRGEKVQDRPLVVQRFKTVAEIKTCHVLFISHSEAAHYEEIFEALKGRSILTVGDVDSFAMRGGMIRFLTDKGKIKLRINIESARAEHLTISSRLLRLAEVVGKGKD